jgi:hypothetical protein
MYGEPLYKEAIIMAAEKTVSMSFRVSPRFKALLAMAAARENRMLVRGKTFDPAHISAYPGAPAAAH